MTDPRQEFESAVISAFVEAIEVIGLNLFLSTSFFGSSERAVEKVAA